MDDCDPTFDEGVDSTGGRKGHGGKVVAVIRSTSDCDLRPGATVCGSLLADHLFAIGGAHGILPGIPSTGEWSAEVAGKTFKMWLRKISEEEHKCWVEMIPHVLRKYHDMPG